MSDLVLWIAAEAERPVGGSLTRGSGPSEEELRGIKPHNFKNPLTTKDTKEHEGNPSWIRTPV